jgi:hypothetical protein
VRPGLLLLRQLRAFLFRCLLDIVGTLKPKLPG